MMTMSPTQNLGLTGSQAGGQAQELLEFKKNLLEFKKKSWTGLIFPLFYVPIVN